MRKLSIFILTSIFITILPSFSDENSFIENLLDDAKKQSTIDKDEINLPIIIFIKKGNDKLKWVKCNSCLFPPISMPDKLTNELDKANTILLITESFEFSENYYDSSHNILAKGFKTTWELSFIDKIQKQSLKYKTKLEAFPPSLAYIQYPEIYGDIKASEIERYIYSISPARISEEKIIMFDNGESVTSSSISSDGKIFATGSYYTVKLWNIDNFSENGKLDFGFGSAIFVIMSPRGDIIAAANNSSIKIWDSINLKEKCLIKQQEICALAFSPNGETLAATDYSGNIILWDTIRFNKINSFNKHEKGFTDLVFSTDGKYLVTCENNGTIHFYNTKEYSEVSKISDNLIGMGQVSLSVDKDLICALVFGNLKIIDISQAKIVNNYKIDSQHVAINSSFNLVAFGTSDKLIKLLNLSNGNIITTFKGHEAEIKQVVFSTRDKILISVDVKGKIIIWDISRYIENK